MIPIDKRISLIKIHGKMKNPILCLFMLLVSGNLFGQNQPDFESFQGFNVSTKINSEIVDPVFYEYIEEEEKILRFQNTSILDIDQQTEESLVKGMFNLTGRIPGDLFLSGEGKNSLNKLKAEIQKDSLRNFCILSHKLSFSFGGQPLSVLKIIEYNDSVAVGVHSIQFKKKGTWWFISDISQVKEIEETVKHIKTEFFWEFYNSSDSKDHKVNELRKMVKDKDGVLDIMKLSHLIIESRNQMEEYCDFL